MSDGARHALAGATGGLAAGALLSAIMGGMAARQGEASELARLERRIGLSPYDEDEGPHLREEAGGHAGHLALSVVAGAGYGLAVRNADAPPVVTGLAFGLGFHVLAYGLLGPALGVTPRPWRDTPSNQLQHLALHAVFGVVTGLVTGRLARRR